MPLSGWGFCTHSFVVLIVQRTLRKLCVLIDHLNFMEQQLTCLLLALGSSSLSKWGFFLPGGPCTQEARSARAAAVAPHPTGLFRVPWWMCPPFGDQDSSPAEPRVPAAEVVGCPFLRSGDGKTVASTLSVSSYFLAYMLQGKPASCWRVRPTWQRTDVSCC